MLVATLNRDLQRALQGHDEVLAQPLIALGQQVRPERWGWWVVELAQVVLQPQPKKRGAIFPRTKSGETRPISH